MDRSPLPIVFFGTPPFAAAILQHLIDEKFNIVAVVTNPDRPVGRHYMTKPSAVKECALRAQLPVLQPSVLSDPSFLATLSSLAPALQLVVAFSILPEAVWALPRYGTINIHPSLLPQYRGAAPINWAIIHGERETGVTLFRLSSKVDGGNILAQCRCPLPHTADAQQMHDTLCTQAALLTSATLDGILANKGPLIEHKQDDRRALRRAPKLNKSNCEIMWGLRAENIYNFIRGLSPKPGAWTIIALDGNKMQAVKIYRSQVTSTPSVVPPGTVRINDGRLFVATQDSWLELIELQRPGRKRMSAQEFIHGLHR